MKRVAILQSNYIPWKGYFDIIRLSDVFVVYDEVQFTKNDWRNRNKIKTAKGLEWLTIPVRQVHLHQKINETELTTDAWVRKHWNSLATNYARAEFFQDLKAPIQNLYDSAPPGNLSSVNMHFIRGICSLLGITTPIVDSSSLGLSGDRNGRLLDAVRQLGGTHYISGPAARDYLDVPAFSNAGIEVVWMDYSGYPEYTQLFPPFHHGVSIIDLLFNTGRRAPLYLRDRAT
jgi:hypothetical protein